MWRKIGAALVAVAVLATPVLAIETMTPPATVPAKIAPVAQPKAKTDPKASVRARVKTGAKISAKASVKSKTARKHQPTKLAVKAAGNQISKTIGKVKGKQIAAAKPSKQHAKVLSAKTKDTKAAEPVETTGSVAPRSVPTPGLY